MLLFVKLGTLENQIAGGAHPRVGVKLCVLSDTPPRAIKPEAEADSRSESESESEPKTVSSPDTPLCQTHRCDGSTSAPIGREKNLASDRLHSPETDSSRSGNQTGAGVTLEVGVGVGLCPPDPLLVQLETVSASIRKTKHRSRSPCPFVTHSLCNSRSESEPVSIRDTLLVQIKVAVGVCVHS